jgi:hypothetical protein
MRFNSRRADSAAVVLVVAAVQISLRASAAWGAEPSTRSAVVFEDFSRDPCWEGHNNAPDPSAGVTKTQDFGFSMTRHAGGQLGEIGGSVWRSLTPASYAKAIPRKTLNDRLSAGGRFSVTRAEGGSGVLIGWFNSTSRGWRTPNSLVFRIDGEAGKFRVFFEYGTQTWHTGGGQTFEGPYQTTRTPLLPADGAPHAWSLDYDPSGAGGRGEITFKLDGQTYKAALEPGHKAEGAVFDRFGIMNVQISGDCLAVWLGDLMIHGAKEDFSRDPQWEGKGNRVTFKDRALRPHHDFGYRTTAFAGGKPGEVGGLVWRIESTRPQDAFSYATPVGQLSLNDELKASGKLCLRAAAADSALLLGWFNSFTPIGAPPANFVGILIEGPSRIGHYVRPVLGTSEGQKAINDVGPIIRPDGRPHDWTVHYSPQDNEGRGRITVTLDGHATALDLPQGARKGNAAFDRFGFLSWHRGGHFVEVYFDDVSYTARTPRSSLALPEERSGKRTPILVGSAKQLFLDHRFIDACRDVALVVNPPIKRSTPVIRSDRPWDAFRIIWYTVAEDHDAFKMWYQAFDDDQWAGGRSRLCYAVSKDGLEWTKPSLGIVEFKGSKDNNIVIDDMVNSTVFIDPHGKPEERYKIIYTIHQDRQWNDVRVGASADGIHWKLPAKGMASISADTQHAAFWDPRINKYVVFFRVTVGGDGKPPYPFVPPIESTPPVVAPKIMRPGRAIGRLEMDDILSPWPTEKIQTVLAADELDPPDSDIYTHSPYAYPYAADAYFLFPMTYQHFRPGETNVGNDGVNDGQFCASRDGIHWIRYDRRPYLERGLPGEPDFGAAQPLGWHIRVGNYLYHYYMAWPWTHGGFRRLTPEQRRARENWGREFIGAAVQRLDGFVSVDASYSGGWLQTLPLVFAGTRLELNINVAAMGEARVEIRDADGRPIPGYQADQCDRIMFNDVAHVVRWQGKHDVAPLAGKAVRLRLMMRSAKLYAFQFCE